MSELTILALKFQGSVSGLEKEKAYKVLEKATIPVLKESVQNNRYSFDDQLIDDMIRNTMFKTIFHIEKVDLTKFSFDVWVKTIFKSMCIFEHYRRGHVKIKNI